jgi:hypothetical protein
MAKIVRGWRRGPWTPESKNHYEYRDKVLLRMGFASYREYLNSDLWQSIRDRVLSENKKCRCCKVNDSQCVHHHDYKQHTLKGKTLRGLVALCNECHVEIEYRGKRKLTDQQEIYRAFQGRRKRLAEQRLTESKSDV